MITRDNLRQTFNQVNSSSLIPDTYLISRKTWAELVGDSTTSLLDMVAENPHLLTDVKVERETHPIYDFASNLVQVVGGHVTYGIKFDGHWYYVSEDEYVEITAIQRDSMGSGDYEDDFECD
jgi:hypothetical protein